MRRRWWWPGWPGWPLCMTNAWSPTRTHHHPPFNDGFIVILSEVNGGLGNARISLEVNIFIIIILHSMPFLSRLTLRECIVAILIASSHLSIFFFTTSDLLPRDLKSLQTTSLIPTSIRFTQFRVFSCFGIFLQQLSSKILTLLK